MYQGDEVAAVAADTEEHAIDAARAVKVEYEPLPSVISVESALAGRAPEGVFPNGNVRAGQYAGESAISPRDSRPRRTPWSRPTRPTSSRMPAWKRTARCASGTATS